MKIVFMGTPVFAKTALQALVEAGYEIPLVITQPDKPKGRKYVLTPSEVKEYALSVGLRVETPTSMRTAEVEEMLREVGADVFIVAAYGKILPKNLLELPSLGCVCIHASLLPAWRGAAPIQRAVMNGDTEGGITMMYMDEGIDTGDIILQKKIAISQTMTAGEYHDEMARLGAESALEYLCLAENGNVPRVKQEGDSCYAEKIVSEDLYVSFEETGLQTHNRIRGLAPVPSAYCMLEGKRVKLHESVPGNGRGEPGKILRADKNGIEVACKEGSVILKTLQSEGKKPMDAASFVNGIRNLEGMRFNG